MRLALLALALVACSVTPPRPAPRRVRRPDWSCQLRYGEVHCDAAGVQHRLDVDFAVLAVAARPRGGAYVLGDEGQLARFSAHGSLSGLRATPLRSLATSHDFVCGLDALGVVWCARDSSQDRVCAAADIAPFRPTPSARDGVNDTLCLLDHKRRSHCVLARAPCERSCLAFPACATPRCIDPCAAASGPEPGNFFSASAPVAATSSE